MKIITTTIFRSYNYGAVLQAYALHKKLNDLGHDCAILNFRPARGEKRFEKVFQKPNNLKELAYNLLPLFKYRESKRKIENANHFFDNNLKLTKKYETYEEIINDKPDADIFFCGSDQIWNPIIHGLSPLYFLDFVDNSKSVKASFAASIGENFIEEKYKSKIKDYLSSFDFVSVREEEAKEILSFTGKNIEVVADPVFLLNKQEWLSISKPALRKGKYILCYFLYQPSFLNKLLKSIKKVTGYKIISVTPDPYSKIYHDVLIRDIGPDGFLGLVADAEMVITSSFHGTALSILLEKQFYSIVEETRGSRITNILKRTELEYREINEKSDNVDVLKKFDYMKVRNNVDAIREESITFIEKVTETAKQRKLDSNAS